MKLLTVMSLAILACAPTLAHAQDASSDARFFTPHERTTPHAIGLSPIDGRYPRPNASLMGLNILNGAGAPVPVDPFLLARPYAPGETAVPLTWNQDAKGRASNDVKGRAAWDGSPGRMSW